MALDTELYNLLPDAAEIISDAKAKIPELADLAVDCEGSPKQPRIVDQLISVGLFYEQVLAHVTLNVGETAVTELDGENVAMVNKLLINLKTVTQQSE